jgi:hypothetical protein
MLFVRGRFHIDLFLLGRWMFVRFFSRAGGGDDTQQRDDEWE